MATFNGTSAADNQNGTSDADLIYGNEGNDTIRGLEGNDTLYGGPGSDIVYGNKGEDVLYGDAGPDTLYGGQGNDTVYGGEDSDFVYGNLGDDLLFGNLGNDTFYGGQGDDTITDTVGINLVYGQLGSDSITVSGVGYGGQDNDTVTGFGNSLNVIYGNMGDDVLQAGDLGDTLYGGQGDDLLNGGAGNDVLYGNSGNDTLNGGDGTDTAVLRSGETYSFSRSGAYLVAHSRDMGTDTYIRDDVEFVSGDGSMIRSSDLAPANPPPPPPPDNVTHVNNAEIAPEGQRPSGGPAQTELYFGAGNPPDHFELARDTTADVELGLTAHNRGLPATDPIRKDRDGVEVYQVNSGMQSSSRTNAQFDFSIVTGIDGDSTPISIDQLVARGPVKIQIDTDLTSGVSYADFTAQQRGPNGGDYGFFHGSTYAFGGDERGQPADVDQNSVNLGFTAIRTLIDGDPSTAGHQDYAGQSGLLDIQLSAIGDDGNPFTTHLRMQVGDGTTKSSPS